MSRKKVQSDVLRAVLLGFCALILSACSTERVDDTVTIWHSYRGAEQQALDTLIESWNRENPDARVHALAVPHDAYTNKLTNAIPRGNGPDLFIAAHERIGDWVNASLIVPAPGKHETGTAPYLPVTVEALSYRGDTYGLPLAFKSLALFVNRSLVDEVTDARLDEGLEEFCSDFQARKAGRYCLVYEAGSFYHHVPWLHSFGGGVFDAAGGVSLARAENAASVAFVHEMIRSGYVPEEATGALVTQLFNAGHAALALNGPWFLGEIAPDVDYAIYPIPAAGGHSASPFLTVEAILFPVKARHPLAAARFASYLAGEEGARIRAVTGRQSVALAAVYDDPELRLDASVRRFRELADHTLPMPNDPRMRAVWEPAAQALRQVLRGGATPAEALLRAQRQFDIATRPDPEPADPVLYLLAAFAGLAGLFWVLRRIWRRENLYPQVRGNLAAYLYILPAALGMLLLVFIPFAVGTLVSLYAHRGGEFTFVGLANFWNILTSQDYAVTDPLSFYFTLGVTILWTLVNVALHVSIGLFLALLLRDPWMRLRGVYRVLLIIPWAVPNYITAIIWKGMFQKQYGAINAMLVWFGIEPVSWFSSFWTSFAANVATNTWLGFPFMMVVSLGALQAIPRDLEEAAEVDGAGRLARFWHITLPLLRPALLPAVILGSVWTFNMFNIIYLVSGGEPGGSTEILITEAYRWAFTRQEQYGYAAAYATLIFIVLLVYSYGTRKLVKEA